VVALSNIPDIPVFNERFPAFGHFSAPLKNINIPRHRAHVNGCFSLKHHYSQGGNSVKTEQIRRLRSGVLRKRIKLGMLTFRSFYFRNPLKTGLTPEYPELLFSDISHRNGNIPGFSELSETPDIAPGEDQNGTELSTPNSETGGRRTSSLVNSVPLSAHTQGPGRLCSSFSTNSETGDEREIQQ